MWTFAALMLSPDLAWIWLRMRARHHPEDVSLAAAGVVAAVASSVLWGGKGERAMLPLFLVMSHARISQFLEGRTFRAMRMTALAIMVIVAIWMLVITGPTIFGQRPTIGERLVAVEERLRSNERVVDQLAAQLAAERIPQRLGVLEEVSKESVAQQREVGRLVWSTLVAVLLLIIKEFFAHFKKQNTLDRGRQPE